MDDCAVRDEIVVLMRDGKNFVEHDRLSISELRNTLPIVGDRLTLHIDDVEGHAAYRVLDRYLVDLRSCTDTGEDATFWVLVVDQFDEDHSDEFDDIVRAIYRQDFATVWRGESVTPVPAASPKKIDRTNRDPEYWTFERKELLRKEREARLEAQMATDSRINK